MNKYAIERNKLIPDAAAWADSVAGVSQICGTAMTDQADRWNKAFHSKMNELALRCGLTPWMEKGKKK